MHTFDHVLNWRLKVGSHLFPGPDGGTCINEVALVAAGFEYRPVLNADGMPDCFSRPICAFAMRLNDLASDNNRQRLLPYVTRLACADTPEVERRRAAYIRRRTWFFFDLLPFDRGLKVLEGALAIGRQADPFASDEVQARLDAVKAEAPTFRSRAAHPPSSKVAAIHRSGRACRGRIALELQGVPRHGAPLARVGNAGQTRARVPPADGHHHARQSGRTIACP